MESSEGLMVPASLIRSVVFILAATTGCSDAAGEAGPGPLTLPGVDAAFTVADTIFLEEVPGDTIAEIGAVDVSPDGQILIGDRYLPRVRLYDEEGRFLAGQGRFGDAPFEYRRIRDVAIDREGRVVVLSFQSKRRTILTPSLQPDTTVPLDSTWLAPTQAQRLGGGGLMGLLAEDGRNWWVYFDGAGAEGWRMEFGPGRIFEVPYWPSFADFHTAAAGDTLVIGNSLLYPIRLYGPDGKPVGELGVPPPSWREAPELERGAFAFTDASNPGYGDALRRWLNSFTVIAGLHVVQDRWLVVSHGRVSTERLTPPFVTVEDALDVYDLRTGEKVLEEIPLPEGARVLGGGPYLHVLTEIPPRPWTVLKLDMLPELKARS